jgi:hypothetical protein
VPVERLAEPRHECRASLKAGNASGLDEVQGVPGGPTQAHCVLGWWYGHPSITWNVGAFGRIDPHARSWYKAETRLVAGIPEDDDHRFAEVVCVCQRLLREGRTDSSSPTGLQHRQRCQSQCTPTLVAEDFETA